MFSYFRYIGLISMLIALMGAAAIGVWSNRLLTSELLDLVIARQHANIQSFSETVWREHNPLSNPAPENLAIFGAHATRYIRPQNPVKITIFSTDVRVLYYGSTPAYVASEGTRVTLFDIERIQRGQIAGRVIHDAVLSDTGTKTPRTMVQSIIPIMRAGVTEDQRRDCATTLVAYCTPEALVEVYTDITKEWNAITSFQVTAGLSILGMILLLAGVLMRATTRAEAAIAKQHEINQALTEAAAAAEASSRDKSEFLASVSHELRTPLNAIIGFSELLKAEASATLSKEQNDYVDDITGSGKHLLGLINDILDFSKAEAGKLQLDMDEQDLGKIIRNSIRFVIPRAESAQVTLVEELPPESVVIVTDAKKLKQVLLNLLANAVKFTPAGGVVRTAVWENVVEKAIMIQISDTGIGIAPKDIPRVLAPFGQVDSKLARKYEGTGLGLPLAKKFVEVMGGKFTLQSEVGVGTVITLTLPKEVSRLQAMVHEMPDASEAEAEQPAA